MKSKPQAEICSESVFQELEEALYGNMCIRSCEEDGQAMDIDELLDKYILLLENEDDTSSSLQPTIDDFQGSAFGDTTKSWEPKMESLEPITEPTLHPKRRLPYRPTILMTRCSFFPSFVDEEFEIGESQESQFLIADKSYEMIPKVTGNTTQNEELVDENPLLANAQNLDYLM